jgi:predicted Zn-dependent protease
MLKEDEASGHLVNLELARLYLKMGNVKEAKKYALMEHKVRPNNIDVNRELAIIADKENDEVKFLQYLKVASRTGSKDPELLSLMAKK